MKSVLQIVKKTKQKKSLLLRLSFLALIIYVLVAFVNQQLTISGKHAELQSLESRLSAQTVQNAELQSLIGEDNWSTYIEKIARETLNYVYPGETIYANIAGD